MEISAHVFNTEKERDAYYAGYKAGQAARTEELCNDTILLDAARYRSRRWLVYAAGRKDGDSQDFKAFAAAYDAVTDAAEFPQREAGDA